MQAHTFVRFAVLILALSAVTVAQQTIVVSGGGAALQSAIDQAQPEDILIVRAAAYEPVAVAEGIAILCDPGVSIFNFAHTNTPALAVSNLPAGQRFRMRGGALTASGLNDSILTVANCAGAAIFENVTTAGATAVVRIGAAAQVAFDACSLIQTDVIDSRAAFADCTIRGRCEGQAPPRNCNALAVIGSRVTISGGEVRGQNAFFVLGPGPAIYLDRGQLTIAGANDTVIAAGTGTPAQPAIRTVAGSILLDPAVQVVSATTPIVGGAQVRLRATPSVRARGVVSGQLFAAHTFCEAGSAVVLLAAAPSTPIETPLGDLWLGVTSLVLDAGVVPASGERVRSLILPPITPAEPTVLQPIALLGSGEVVVGTVAGFVQN